MILAAPVMQDGVIASKEVIRSGIVRHDPWQHNAVEKV